MNLQCFVLGGLVAAMSASMVMAQTPPPPPSPPAVPITHFDGQSGVDRMQRENFSRAITNQVAGASPARANRAERVAALINAGKCTDAVALARDEGDRRLARRVETVCRDMPASPAAN